MLAFVTNMKNVYSKNGELERGDIENTLDNVTRTMNNYILRLNDINVSSEA